MDCDEMERKIASVHCSNCGNKINISEKKCPNCNAFFIYPEFRIRRLKKLLIGGVLFVIIWSIFLILSFYLYPDFYIRKYFYLAFLIFMIISMIAANIFLTYIIRRNSVLLNSPKFETAYKDIKLENEN